MAVGQIALGTARPQTAEMRLKHAQIIKRWMEEKLEGFASSALIFFSACAGSEGHHLWAAEDCLRRGVWAQQQRQHRETQVHVHPRLQEARLYCKFGSLFTGSEHTLPLIYYYKHMKDSRSDRKTQASLATRGGLIIGHPRHSLQNLQIKTSVYLSWHVHRNRFWMVLQEVFRSFTVKVKVVIQQFENTLQKYKY